MVLIGINKIANYINQHPEARVPLLTWLKEFPYLQTGWNSLDHEGKPYSGSGEGGFGVGTGTYWINYAINYDAETDRITWVGSEAERKAEMDKRVEEELRKYPNAVTSTVSKTFTLSPTAPDPDMEMDSFTFTTIAGGTSTVSEKKRDPAVIYAEPALAEGKGFQDIGEYEKALSRATVVFNAAPGTSEFDELTDLLPLIRDFESHKLKFPLLHNFEIIKDRLAMFDMKPTDLPAIDGGEEQINLFLNGKLELPDEIVDQIFKVLFIRIPVGDKRFSVNSPGL